MNLSEVHSLSPAFPDVVGGRKRAATAGGYKSFGGGPTMQYTEGKLKPRGG